MNEFEYGEKVWIKGIIGRNEIDGDGDYWLKLETTSGTGRAYVKPSEIVKRSATPEFENGEKVEVKEKLIDDWESRTYSFTSKNGTIFCVNALDKNNPLHMKGHRVFPWKYARKLQKEEPEILSHSELSKKILSLEATVKRLEEKG